MAPGAGLVGGRHDRGPRGGLARELALCYTAVALVTDLDAGLEHGEGVTHDEVLRVFAENIDKRARPAARRRRPACPARTTTASCRHALDGQKLPFDLP